MPDPYIFISYSVKDFESAQMTCSFLEDRGIRCWMAPRDIKPGSDWAESIMRAIIDCESVVFLYSDHTNGSFQIRREIEHAVSSGKSIITLKLDDSEPSLALKYYITTYQWLDSGGITDDTLDFLYQCIEIDTTEQDVPEEHPEPDTPENSEEDEELVPKTDGIEGYKILRPLGRGGMGTVYEAIELDAGRLVAIKVLDMVYTENPAVREAFFNEAKVSWKLNHPNLVVLHDLIEFSDHRLALVMEYVDGKSLDELIENSGPVTFERGMDGVIGKDTGPIPWERAKHVFLQILEGVGYLHDRDVVHRDLKPSNIIITKDQEVKITDFGVSQFTSEQYSAQTGRRAGTLPYMSPEQVLGKEVDHRADIYSLGMTLYEMLAGRLPFDFAGEDTKLVPAPSNRIGLSENSEQSIMSEIIRGEIPDPREFFPFIPESVAAVVQKATSSKAGDRYDSVLEMKEALSLHTELGGADSEHLPEHRDPEPPEKPSIEGMSHNQAALKSSTQSTSRGSGESDRAEPPTPLKQLVRNRSLLWWILGAVATVLVTVLVWGLLNVKPLYVCSGEALSPPALVVADSIPFGSWFRDIEMVARDSAGNMAVLDGERMELSILDPAGEYREGLDLSEIPTGALQVPVGLVFLSDGRLAISDLGTAVSGVGCLLVFDAWSGDLSVHTDFERMPPLSISALGEGFAGAEYYIDEGYMGYRVYGMSEDSTKTVLYVYGVPLDYDDEVVDGVLMDIPLVTTSGDSVVYAALRRSGEMRVNGLDPRGNLTVTLDLDGPSVPQASLHIEREMDKLERYYNTTDTEWAPDSLRPVVSYLGVDSLGRLWVRKGTELLPTFDVYSTTGDSLFTVAVEDSMLCDWEVLIDQHGILAWPRDEAERQRIYRLEFRNDPGSQGSTSIPPIMAQEVGVRVVLCIDASSSVSRHLEQMKEAISAYVDSLRPQDYVSIITFGDSYDVVAPFTNDKNFLKSTIEGIEANSHRSALYRAVYQSIMMLREGGQSLERRFVIVISDGWNESLSDAYDIDDCIDAARADGVIISTIGLTNPYAQYPADLEAMAQRTGGIYNHGADDAASLHQHLLESTSIQGEITENRVEQFLDEWVAAWESRSISRYSRYYSNWCLTRVVTRYCCN